MLELTKSNEMASFVSTAGGGCATRLIHFQKQCKGDAIGHEKLFGKADCFVEKFSSPKKDSMRDDVKSYCSRRKNRYVAQPPSAVLASLRSECDDVIGKKYISFLSFAIFVLLAAIATGGCDVPGPDGPADSFGLDFSMPANSQADGAIVFLVDGLNADVFGKMLDAGQLPNFKKYFIDRGLYAPRAAANIPSVTLVNLLSIATGRFAGDHGIVGIRWFDREKFIWRNYATIAQKNTLDGDYSAPTIYEQFADRQTFSLFYQPHRGVTHFFENWTSAGPPFFFQWFEFVDRIALWRFGEMMAMARSDGKFPGVTMVYQLSPDFYAYRRGFDSPEYRHAITHADRQIGRVLGDVARAGLLDRITIAVVSDHGHMAVDKHFPLDKFLADDLGLKLPAEKPWEETGDLEKRRLVFESANAVTAGSGDKYWAIYLRKPSADGTASQWSPRCSAADIENYPIGGAAVNIPAKLISQPAVDAVAYSIGKDSVRVLLKGGCVEFSSADGGATISCRITAGDDPLGWGGKVPPEFLTGAAAPQRKWLEMTLATDYPDAPAQILAYFRSRLAGDIAVFAAPTWDFDDKNLAGHGGLRAAEMLVPMMIAGPGVPHEKIDVARTVDLMPTILKLLGRKIPTDIDGQPMVK